MDTTKPKKRAGQCAKEGCKAKAAQGRGGKCMAHYLEDYRRGERLAEPDNVGENPGRLDFKVRRELLERFHTAVPAQKRRKALHDALGAYLDNLAKETT